MHIQLRQKSSLVNYAEQLVRKASDNITTSRSKFSFIPDFLSEETATGTPDEIATAEAPKMRFVPSEILNKKNKAKRSQEILEKAKITPQRKSATKRLASSKPERVAGLHGLIHFESGKVELKWHAQQEAKYYTVQVNETSYDELQWQTLATSTDEKVELKSLEKGKEYYFRVKAHAEEIAGEWSGLCCLKLKVF